MAEREMSKSEKFVYESLKRVGTIIAKELQSRVSTMSATEVIEEEDYLPMFNPAKQYLNKTAGYCCKDETGHRWKLIQPYDSTIYTDTPENLPAQWGILYSKNYMKADTVVISSTSPYSKGDVCIDAIDGVNYIWQSAIDNNTWKPSDVLSLQRGGQSPYWYCLGKEDELKSGEVHPVSGLADVPSESVAE